MKDQKEHLLTRFEETFSQNFLTCERCATLGSSWDAIDRKIFHDNNHVWPGFAGEPTGDDFGGSDF